MKNLSLILVLFLANTVSSQIREVNLFLNKRDISTIEREAGKFLKLQKLPGMTLVIANNGRIIFSKSYGFASVSRKVKLEPKHKIAINNCTQVFTTVAIMKLLEEGKISLEDRVVGPGSIFEKEFPVVRKFEAMVTVRHLVEQTVGAWSHFAYLRYLKGKNDIEKMKTFLTNVRMTKEPGRYFSDSELAYFLLGRIIEKKTGKKYLEYLQEIMKEHIESDLTALGESNVKDVAIHYDEKSKPFNISTSRSNFNAKNNIVCSPHDFMNLLLSIDGLPAKKDLLTEAAVKILHTKSNVKTSTGKGWRFTENDDITDHSFRTASSAVYKMRADGISWVFMANGRSYRAKSTEKFYYFPDLLLSKLKDIP